MNQILNKYRQMGATTAQSLQMVADFLRKNGMSDQEIDLFFDELLERKLPWYRRLWKWIQSLFDFL